MAIARPVDRRLFFILDRAHTRLAKEADNYLAKNSGISSSQAAVLIYLGYHDRCRLTDLAEGTGRNNAAITGLVTRMEADDLLERITLTTDRRAKAVALTDAGWALREQVMNDFRDFNDRLVKGLSDTEVEAVLKFLALAPNNVKVD
jgi:DNA-binding MarR family transcriptional regulator